MLANCAVESIKKTAWKGLRGSHHRLVVIQKYCVKFDTYYENRGFHSTVVEVSNLVECDTSHLRRPESLRYTLFYITHAAIEKT
jgi:hypothetical protein